MGARAGAEAARTIVRASVGYVPHGAPVSRAACAAQCEKASRAAVSAIAQDPAEAKRGARVFQGVFQQPLVPHSGKTSFFQKVDCNVRVSGHCSRTPGCPAHGVSRKRAPLCTTRKNSPCLRTFWKGPDDPPDTRTRRRTPAGRWGAHAGHPDASRGHPGRPWHLHNKESKHPVCRTKS